MPTHASRLSVLQEADIMKLKEGTVKLSEHVRKFLKDKTERKTKKK